MNCESAASFHLETRHQPIPPLSPAKRRITILSVHRSQLTLASLSSPFVDIQCKNDYLLRFLSTLVMIIILVLDEL